MEYEYRYSEHAFDKDVLMRKLEETGYKYTKNTYLLRNTVYNSPPGYYVRIREMVNLADKKSDSYFTVKKLGEGDGDFDEEYEVFVEDAALLHNSLLEFGITENYKIEKIREVVSVPEFDGELDFDMAPGLPWYLEVECKTKEMLDKFVGILGLPARIEKFSIADMYRRCYGVDSGMRKNMKILTFEKPGDVRECITMNIEGFDKILEDQRKMM